MDLLTQVTQQLSSEFSSQDYPASVLVALTDEAEPKVLLSRRASHLSSHAGEVSFLGGKREQLDTDNISVALRETHEEAGIVPSEVSVLGELPVEQSRSGLKVLPIIGLVPTTVTLIAEESEVARLFWVKLSDFHEQNITPYEVNYKGARFNTASFQLENEIIWGLTGRIICNLINKLYNKNLRWQMIMPAS